MNVLGGFLSNDSPFGRLMTKCGTVILANILFAVCCIPVVTAGAAIKGLYTVVFTMLRAEDAINPLQTFWQGFRTRLIQTTLCWAAFLAVLGLGVVDLQVCMQAKGPLGFLSAGVMAVLLIASITGAFFFPLSALYSETPKQLIQRSIFFAVRRPVHAAVILLLQILLPALFVLDETGRPNYAFIGAFFGFGLTALVCAKLLEPQIRRYPPTQEDSSPVSSGTEAYHAHH